MDKFKICLPTFLAVVSTLMVVGILCAMAFVDIPEKRMPAFQNVSVMVIGQWIGVMGYFFGSSSGSAAKSKAIETMVADNNSTEEKK